MWCKYETLKRGKNISKKTCENKRNSKCENSWNVFFFFKFNFLVKCGYSDLWFKMWLTWFVKNTNEHFCHYWTGVTQELCFNFRMCPHVKLHKELDYAQASYCNWLSFQLIVSCSMFLTHYKNASIILQLTSFYRVIKVQW